MIAAVAVVLALTSGSVNAVMQTLTFKVVAEGQASSIEEPREVIVRTAAEWKALWEQHSPGQKLPTIDFTKSMVVGIFLGTRNTGGYRVVIQDVTSGHPDAVVTWREEAPGPGLLVTQALTAPFQIVTFDKQPGNVKFVKDKTLSIK
jgi:hypothetical protein